MKKQKFMKLSAFASDPSIENSFSSPVTHNSEISVVFGGKNISIHGWDGSAWTTIYTWNGLDQQFTFENTYQSYFLKSLTGSEELMRVSFFSGDRYQGSTPLMAGVNRDMKLYDVDEVPVYTASDASKLLTIMSDGSLRWLGISESYVVEVIGGGGETPSEGNAVPVEFFEDRMHSSTFANYASPANYLFYSSYDDATGVLTAGRGADRVATLNISGATEPFATNNDAANDGDLTKKVAISFWYKGTAWKTGSRTYASLFNVLNETGQTLFGMRMTKNDWYSGFFVGTPYSNDSLSGANAFTNENGFHIDNISDDNWHHIAYYYDGASTGGQKIFVDGVLAASKAHGSGAVTIDRYMSSGANSMVFNANNKDDYTGGDFDSVTFYQGFEFTEAMAAEIYSDSTRQGSISQP